MTKKFKINDKLLNATLYVFVGDKNECEKEIKKLDKRGFDERCKRECVDAVAGYINNKDSYIWLENFELTPYWISVLSHELIHFVDKMFYEANIYVSHKEDEILAYYHEFWLRECLNKLM